jgi:phosphohistidine phosphatase
MKKRGLIPDLVVSSGALRALTTARGLVAVLHPELSVLVNDQLYFAGKKAVYGAIRETSNEVGTLFLVLHNPDINEIVLDDLGYDDDNVPTLGVAMVRAKCASWADWKPKQAKVEELIKPKKL